MFKKIVYIAETWSEVGSKAFYFFNCPCCSLHLRVTGIVPVPCRVPNTDSTPVPQSQVRKERCVFTFLMQEPAQRPKF